jgi:hypothetical protein
VGVSVRGGVGVCVYACACVYVYYTVNKYIPVTLLVIFVTCANLTGTFTHGVDVDNYSRDVLE